MKTIKTTLDQLAAVMEKKSIRSEELAYLAILGISTVKLAKGGKEISETSAKRIAAALKCKLSDLQSATPKTGS